MRIPETTEEKIAQLQLLVGKVKELETKLEAYTSSNYCITCSSGTDALILSLLALNIGKAKQPAQKEEIL